LAGFAFFGVLIRLPASRSLFVGARLAPEVGQPLRGLSAPDDYHQ